MYILSLIKDTNKAEPFTLRYRVVIQEVITAGLASAIKNHALSYEGNYLYAFGGINKINPVIIIRKLCIDTKIWEEVEKNINLDMSVGLVTSKSVMKFGPVIITSHNHREFLLLYDTRLNTSSIMLTDGESIFESHFGLYYIKLSTSWNRNYNDIGIILPHDYYKIKPIPYSFSNLPLLLSMTIGIPAFTNLTIKASDGIILVNYLILAIRGKETISLLAGIENNEITIQKYPLSLIKEIILYLYTDIFPDSIPLKDLLNFAHEYHMSNLISLCNIARVGNQIINSAMVINSDIKLLYSLHISEPLKLNHNSSSLENYVSEYLKPDFLIIADGMHPCHKLFLHLRSEFIRNLLYYNPETTSIELTNFSSNAIQAMIKYCYGFNEVENSILGEVMSLARYLDMAGLFLKCQEQISKIVTPTNFLSIYEMAYNVNSAELLRFLNEYAKIMGFKYNSEHILPSTVLDELKKIKNQEKFAKKNLKKTKKIVIEGESPEETAARLLALYPLPNQNDPIPDGLKEMPVINNEIAIFENYLSEHRNQQNKIVKDICIVLQDSDEEEPATIKYNRFQDFDSDI